MRLLLIASFSLIALADYSRAQSVSTTTHEPDGAVVVSGMMMGKKYSFSVRAPTDWMEVTYPNLPPAFFPRQGDSIDRSIFISAFPFDKSGLRVKNGQELAILDEKRDQIRDSQTRYQPAGTLKTADGASIPLYFVRRSNSCGLLAYADEGRTITALSLVCPTDEALQASRSIFEQFIASYRSLAPQSHTKRR